MPEAETEPIPGNATASHVKELLGLTNTLYDYDIWGHFVALANDVYKAEAEHLPTVEWVALDVEVKNRMRESLLAQCIEKLDWKDTDLVREVVNWKLYNRHMSERRLRKQKERKSRVEKPKPVATKKRTKRVIKKRAVQSLSAQASEALSQLDEAGEDGKHFL